MNPTRLLPLFVLLLLALAPGCWADGDGIDTDPIGLGAEMDDDDVVAPDDDDAADDDDDSADDDDDDSADDDDDDSADDDDDSADDDSAL